MSLGLEGKNVLVTGGSRGIGRGIVHALARAGANVAAVYRTPSEAVDQMERELKEIGGKSTLIQADVSNSDAVESLFSEYAEFADSVDVLVNNAGTISHIPFQELTEAEWRRVLDTNLTAPFLVSQKAIPLIPAGGSIINIGSKLARVGLPLRTHYIASKAGMEGLNRSLAKELGPKQIRVNLVAPGVIETESVTDPKLLAAMREKYSNLTALGRLGQTDDVAGVVLFLASDLSKYMTGEIVTVDGGI
jgi:3-oxoacyl-[acyl-carrier protein] reductase